MTQETKLLYNFGRFTLRISDRVLLLGDQELSLSPRAYELLNYFVTNPEGLVSREELKVSVWHAANVSDNSVDQKIGELRKVFAEADPSTEYIKNKHGHGWRFVVPVERRIDVAVPAIAPSAIPQKALPKRRSKYIYAAALVSVAIATGAVLRIKGMLVSEPRIIGYRQLTNDGLPKDGRLIYHDGLVYFTEHVTHDADAEVRISAVPSSGGEVQYPAPPHRPASLMDIAAQTGDRVYAYGARYDTASAVLLRTNGRAVETGAETPDASISPDGSVLAYGDQHDNLRLESLGKGALSLGIHGSVNSPRWSRDGQRVRFTKVEAPSLSSSLWEVGRDGNNLRRLEIQGEMGSQVWSEGWTADGRYFLYSDYGTHGLRSNLWIVPDDKKGGMSARPVRLNTPMDFRFAVAGPDTSTIFAIGTKIRNELVRFDLKRREFVPFWSGFPAIDISFSKDKTRAAFTSHEDLSLWVSRADGLERMRITWPPMEANQPHWSPDGRQISFMGHLPGKLWRMFIVNSTGGIPQEVDPEDPLGHLLDQGVPSWSADGKSLVMGELRLRRPDAEMQIRVVDLMTRRETVLPGSKGKWSPRWSPDGSSILAETTDFKELALFDCKTQTWRTLARGTNINDAAWSPDGKFIHYEAFTEPGRMLFRVPIGAGKAEELALQPEFEYSWSGVAPDGSPLTLRAVKLQEIYALDLKLP